MGFNRTLPTQLMVLLSLSIYVTAARLLLTDDDSLFPSDVPAALAVPSNNELHVTYYARGYQYYRYNGSAWVNFKAKAILFDDSTKLKVGRHFYLTVPDALGGQPSWETVPSRSNQLPHSRVTGKAITKLKVNTNSIAWVLLQATESSGSKSQLGGVSYIQRLETSRGLGPKATNGVRVGEVKKSFYTAIYAFYVPTA